MRNLKKVLSLSLAMVMLFGMMVIGAGAATYTDVADGSDKEEAIEVMTAIEVMQGPGNNQFNPKGTLTRAEAAMIVARAVMTPKTVKVLSANVTESQFADVNAHSSWAASAIEACVSQGIIAGDGAGNFNPTNQVTGTQFAAMLLRALGFDPTRYTGSSWEINARRDALDAGLDEGVNMVGSLSREDAAQMALNALMYDPAGTKWTIEGSNGLTFDSMTEAALYKALLDLEGDIVRTPGSGSLATKNFKLANAYVEDENGRSFNVWTVDGKAVVALEVGSLKNYTTSVTEGKIYTDLGASGIKGTSARYIVLDSIVVDGVTKTKTVTETDDEGKETTKEETLTLDITQGSTKTFSYSGNGVNVAFYATNSKNHYDCVVVNEYLGTVAKVNKATTVADRSVSVKVGDATLEFETEEFEKGDAVLYTLGQDDGATVISSMKLADVVVDATIKSFTDSRVVTSAGTYYYAKVNDGKATTSDLGETVDLYLDSCGYLKALDVPEAAPVSTFAYIEATDATYKAASGLTGGQPSGSAQVRAVLADGTVGIYNLTISRKNGNFVHGDYVLGAVTELNSTAKLAQAVADLFKGQVLGYTLSSDGKSLTLSAPTAADDEDLASGISYVNALTADYTSGTIMKATKDVLVNGKTTFVVISGSGNDTKASVSTGSLTLGEDNKLTSADTVVVMTRGNASTGVATVVFTTADTGTVVGNAAGYAYVNKSSASYGGTAQKPVVTYTGTAMDGSTVTLTAGLEDEDTEITVATGVWAYNSDNEMIGKVLASKKVTVIGEQINFNGKWYNLTGSTQYVFVNRSLTEANGNYCVVIPDSNGRNAVAVFVISKG